MSKRQNLLAVWQQIPVANRTVEVNTKTGFSLTAGSYSIHATSNQRGTILVDAATSNTAAISSVTTTRSLAMWEGAGPATDTFTGGFTRITLTNATTVTATTRSAASDTTVAYQVEETY